MAIKTLLEESKIADTVDEIPGSSFTILDFIQIFRDLYLEDRRRLAERFGAFGEKRRYTVSTYLSNRLDVYSRKPHSLLKPLIHYSEGKFEDHRRITLEEQKVFGNRWIAVFKKREVHS